MTAPATTPRVVRFGVFELDQRTGELRKAGVRLNLQGQPLQILTMPLERPGELVTREELRQRLWAGDTFVDFENGLNAAVKRLRQVLGDAADAPRFIETLPRRGYRLIAGVDGREMETPRPLVPRPRRRPALAAGGALVIAALLAWSDAGGLRTRLKGGVPRGRIESLAVLPLENLSRDPEQDYFVEGMHEALITDLAKLSGLRRVIARSSVIRYRKTEKSLPEIARELNVDAIVTGAVLQDAGRVRVTAQLIRASSEELLWTEHYEREYRDVIALQGEVVGAIARGIEIKLTPTEELHLAQARPVKGDVYEAYLRGRYHRNRFTHAHYRQAIAYFERAVAQDPGYAPAHAGLAYACGLIGGWGNFAPREWLPRAKASALKALEIDDRLAEAHVSLASIKAHYDWDWPGAEREFKTAVELDPGYAEGHDGYAIFLARMGRHDQARGEIDRALQLDPYSVNVNDHWAWVAFMARDYERAAVGYRRTLDLDPDHVPALRELAWVYTLVDKHAEAIESAERASRLSPEDSLTSGHLASIYARGGRRKDASRLLARLMQRRQVEYVSPMSIAQAYVGLGDKDRAFEWLNKAFEDRSGRLVNVRSQPNFDMLRGDPRLDDLLRRMDFPP